MLLDLAKGAAVVAGTWRRWSGRLSLRPTTQSSVRNVAVWDLDTCGTVLIVAMRTPLALRGRSKRKNGKIGRAHV